MVLDTQAQPRQMLLGADIIKPAAQAAPQGEEEPKDRAWLRNLVCGFDMEIPAERLQQDTVGEPKLMCCAWNHLLVSASLLRLHGSNRQANMCSIAKYELCISGHS
jgi:hypothetical protein